MVLMPSWNAWEYCHKKGRPHYRKETTFVGISRAVLIHIQTVTFLNPKTPEKVAVSFKTYLINHSKLVFIFKSNLVPNTIFLVIYKSERLIYNTENLMVTKYTTRNTIKMQKEQLCCLLSTTILHHRCVPIISIYNQYHTNWSWVNAF